MKKHYWSEFDGQDLQQFRDDLTQQKKQQKAEVKNLEARLKTAEKQKEAKTSGSADQVEAQKIQEKLAEAKVKDKATSQLERKVSQTIGENYGHQFCTEKLGYKTILHEDSKGMAQGFDSVYHDPKAEETVVAEFKGQSGQLSKEQKKTSWTPQVADKVIAGEGKYQKASASEWQAAKHVKEAHSRGELRYEVFRTKVDKGRVYTELEKRNRLSESPEKRQESSNYSQRKENKSETTQAMKQYCGVKKQSNTEKKSQSQSESKSEGKKG